MNSQATSAMAWRRHRSAIAARLVNLREIDRKAFWEFCNTICHEQTFVSLFEIRRQPFTPLRQIGNARR
jgi:hypothetical protein